MVQGGGICLGIVWRKPEKRERGRLCSTEQLVASVTRMVLCFAFDKAAGSKQRQRSVEVVDT